MGTVNGEPLPMGWTQAGEAHEEPSPVGGTPLWSREGLLSLSSSNSVMNRPWLLFPSQEGKAQEKVGDRGKVLKIWFFSQCPALIGNKLN